MAILVVIGRMVATTVGSQETKVPCAMVSRLRPPQPIIGEARPIFVMAGNLCSVSGPLITLWLELRQVAWWGMLGDDYA